MATPEKFPLTVAVTPIDLAAYLMRNGVKVVGKPMPITESKDGEVKMSDTLHVQVGQGYALIVDKFGEREDVEWTMGEQRHDGRDILNDIRAKLRQKPG